MFVEYAAGKDLFDEFLLLIAKLRWSGQVSIRIARNIAPLFLGTSTKRGNSYEPLACDSGES
jgi:hypothetical protein